MQKPAGDELRPDGGEVGAQPPHEQLIDVRRADRPDAVLVVVHGAVDLLTAPRLRAALVSALDERADRPVVVDLTEAGFLGSAGLHVLAECAGQAAARPGFQPLRLAVDHNRPVLRPIQMTGYDALLALYHDVDDAVAGNAPHRGR